MRWLLAILLAAPACAADLLIQGALDWELQPLLSALQNRHEVKIAAWTFWTGRIGGHDVVISRTDVGPINAAAATALGIREFRPAVVINQGTAGAHNPDLKVYGSDTEDMESAYAAGTAVAMKTPFVAIRIVSDSEFSHPHLERRAGEYVAAFLAELAAKCCAEKAGAGKGR